MAVSRRFLLTAGAASAVLITGGGWLGSRTATSAREPWRAAARGLGDPRLDALAYAILAPNPHNMQPWQIRLEPDNALSVFTQEDRLLPATDPPCRQITIGFGCFLELLRQAAAEKGFHARVTPFPEGEPQPVLDHRPVARVQLIPDPQLPKDPLFASVLTRHTQRAPFDTERAVPGSALAQITAAAPDSLTVGSIDDKGTVAGLRSLTRAAWETEWSTDSARGETVRVTRIGKDEVAARPWGITLDGAFFGLLRAFGLLSRESMGSVGTAGYAQSLEVYGKACDTAMAYVWSSTAANTRLDQLRAGAGWVRMQQAANQLGIAFHPLSQALQEFVEMRPHYMALHEQLAAPGHTLQMLVRLGYAPSPGPSPRQPLEARLLPA